jgi:hypothetical protein
VSISPPGVNEKKEGTREDRLSIVLSRITSSYVPAKARGRASVEEGEVEEESSSEHQCTRSERKEGGKEGG